VLSTVHIMALLACRHRGKTELGDAGAIKASWWRPMLRGSTSSAQKPGDWSRRRSGAGNGAEASKGERGSK